MKRWRLIGGCAALLGLLGLLGLVPPAFGQGAPMTQTIPPGATADFIVRTCGPQRPCIPGGFTVRSQASEPVTATFDPPTLTLTLAAPVGVAVQILSGCAPDAGPASVVRCRVGGLSSPPTVTVTFTTVAAPAQGEMVTLFSGCNNVTLTWPTGTPTSEVAAAVTPASALIAIWRFNNATQTFQGFSPLPNAPNDFTSVNRADPAFICMRESGSLTRPSI